MARPVNKSQTQLVLEHLKKHRTITPLEALHVYKIYRLSSVIQRLREKGWGIKTEMKHDAMGGEYGQYVLTMPWHERHQTRVTPEMDKPFQSVQLNA